MKNISYKKTLVASKDVLFQELSDGESVFLNLDNETYYGLDTIGTEMWKVLTNSKSIDEAYTKLLADYKVEKETLRKDLDEIINTFIEKGLAIITDKDES